MGSVSEVGRRPIAGGLTTPASIDTAQTITMPTIKGPGVLECTVVVEGTVASRYTWNGTTPTAAVGLPLPAAAAGVPVTFILRGAAIIQDFKIIGVAAGNSWTYQFAMSTTA